MKVDVTHGYVPTNLIRLRLLSSDMQFRCIMPPNPNEQFLDPFGEPNEAKIIFNDTWEIDNLIQMLEKFKSECCDRMGNWERSKNND